MSYSFLRWIIIFCILRSYTITLELVNAYEHFLAKQMSSTITTFYLQTLHCWFILTSGNSAKSKESSLVSLLFKMSKFFIVWDLLHIESKLMNRINHHLKWINFLHRMRFFFFQSKWKLSVFSHFAQINVYLRSNKNARHFHFSLK